MKILSASVADPRTEGNYRNPYLLLEVDEDIRETGEPTVLGDWLVTPHGPFVSIDSAVKRSERRTKGEIWEPGDIGRFNTTGLHPAKLVEVTVASPDEEIDLAMGLERARRLVRKHEPSWRYVLDDHAGQNGCLVWRLVTPYQRCVTCQRPVEDEQYYRGTYLPYCSDHLAEHNKMIRNMRVKTA